MEPSAEKPEAAGYAADAGAAAPAAAVPAFNPELVTPGADFNPCPARKSGYHIVRGGSGGMLEPCIHFWERPC